MRTATIKCEQCSNTYSISEPDFIGDMRKLINENAKVSTEVGCPKCLCPDGILIHIDPLVLPIERILSNAGMGRFPVEDKS